MISCIYSFSEISAKIIIKNDTKNKMRHLSIAFFFSHLQSSFTLYFLKIWVIAGQNLVVSPKWTTNLLITNLKKKKPTSLDIDLLILTF